MLRQKPNREVNPRERPRESIADRQSVCLVLWRCVGDGIVLLYDLSEFNLLKFMDTQILATDHVLHANLAKFVCVHSNSGHVHALNVGAGLQSES